MKVEDGQRLGAMAVLIAALFVYSGAAIHNRHHLPVSPLPWGDQGPGRIAVEVTGGQGADGVYFLPEATVVRQLSEITGYKVGDPEVTLANAHRSGGGAFSVSVAGEVLKITDMASVTRYSLGLPIHLNRATEEDLSLIPGVGMQLARQIVELRQLRGGFRGLEELTAVPGIKEKKLRLLEKHLWIEPDH